MKLNEGIWGVANRVRNYKIIFADPETGQVGYFGVAEENDHPQILALRLRIEDQKISEIVSL